MDVQEYKSRLYSILTRVEPIVETCGHKDEVDSIKKSLANTLEDNSEEGVSKTQLDNIKAGLVTLLQTILTEVQIAFVEMKEPDDSDAELFKKYLLELKDFKQDLSSPISETRKKVSSLLKHTKANLLNEISSQSIIFPTECLDTILASPEVGQENGAQWVLNQINQALNALLEEVNTKLGATFDAVNEILGSEIDALDTSYSQAIELGRQTESSTSDNVLGIARQALPSLGIGSVSYGAAAFLLGPIAGAVAGLAAGGWFLFNACNTTKRQRKVMELKQQLSPKLTLAMNELKTYVIERYDEFEEGISNSIEVMNELVAIEMQDCLDALKSCEQDTKIYDSSQRTLYNRMNALETYIKQLELLMNNPFEK